MFGDVRPKNTAEGATDRDEAIKPLALLDREQVCHEGPEDGSVKEIEDAHPDKERSSDPDLLLRRAGPHQDEKKRKIKNEKPVGERDEPSARHARHDGSEHGISDQHGHERGRKHPRQCFKLIAARDAVADRAHDVIAGQNKKMEQEPEPQRANLVLLYVNDFGEKFLHAVAAVLWAACTRRTS